MQLRRGRYERDVDGDAVLYGGVRVEARNDRLGLLVPLVPVV